jgi:prefoldin alpha subunit
MDETQLQEKYQQFQMLQQQMEQINEHLQLLNQQNAELDISCNALTELGKTELNKEILTPISDGIFLKAELKNNKTVVVNVGSDTTVEKTIPETVVLLQNQKRQISEKILEAENILQEFNTQAMSIYQEVESSQPQENVRETKE